MVTPVGLYKGCANLSRDYVSKKLNKRDLENFPILFSEHSNQPLFLSAYKETIFSHS